MKLYNLGRRSFIVPKTDIVSGGRDRVHDFLLTPAVYVDPDTSIEVTPEVGKKLLAAYPGELKTLA